MKIDIDALAQEIRRVDGSNSLSAGALAEALMPFFDTTPANPAQVTERAILALKLRQIPTTNIGDAAVIGEAADALAAIGAGGQAVACKECDGTGFKDKNGARLTLARNPCDACGGSGYAPSISHPADERVVEALRIAEERLSSLLARIHRDGGHYEAAHGTEKAWADADEIVARIYADDTHPVHSPAFPTGGR